MKAPIDVVPPVKVVAAQGFHDIVLDPRFAENRYGDQLLRLTPAQ